MSSHTPARPEVLDFLLSRRSHPAVSLGEPGPDGETLQKILTAAARVPDHGKLAPWRFVLYQGDARGRIGTHLAALAEARFGPLDGARRQQELTRFTRAPLVVGVFSRAAVHPKIPVWEQELSAGAVCMTLVTAATAAGFGVQWVSEWIAFDAEAIAYLGGQPDEKVAGFIHIGTAMQPPFERPRPDLAEIVTTWTGA